MYAARYEFLGIKSLSARIWFNTNADIMIKTIEIIVYSMENS